MGDEPNFFDQPSKGSEWSDPYSPLYTPEWRKNKIDSLGYKYFPGEWGPSARVADQFGNVTTEGAVLKSSFTGQPLPGAKTSTDLTAQAGYNPDTGKYEYFTLGPGGKPIPTGWSVRDPNAITAGQSAQVGLGYAQLAETERANKVREEQAKAEALQRAAESEQRAKNDAAQIALKNKEIANTEVQNSFLRDMSKFQAATGLTKEANETQQRLFENQVSLQNMVNQRDTIQAQMDMNAVVENARNQLATQQANLQYQSQREARLQSLAGDIGKLAADPGSRAQLASTLLANRGWGEANRALSQGVQITDESLQPLAQDLALREQIRSQPAAPYQFTPIQAPRLPSIDLSKIQLPQFQTTPSISTFMLPTTVGATTPTTTAPSGGTGVNVTLTPGALQSLSGQAGGKEAVLQALNIAGFKQAPPESITSTAPSGSNTSRGFAKGGMTYAGNFIVGDSKSGRPTGYEEMIVNPTNAPIKVVPNFELPKYFGGTMPQRYADGTTDGSVFGELPMQDTTEARNFLAKSIQNALSGTPWTTANLPSAVYASTPGTDPVVAQLLASLNSQARGIPAETFLRQASLLAPSGATQSVTRRTA